MTYLWHEGGLLLFRVTGMAPLQGVQGVKERRLKCNNLSEP
jgi:hypothetical protein